MLFCASNADISKLCIVNCARRDSIHKKSEHFKSSAI